MKRNDERDENKKKTEHLGVVTEATFLQIRVIIYTLLLKSCREYGIFFVPRIQNIKTAWIQKYVQTHQTHNLDFR